MKGIIYISLDTFEGVPGLAWPLDTYGGVSRLTQPLGECNGYLYFSCTSSLRTQSNQPLVTVTLLYPLIQGIVFLAHCRLGEGNKAREDISEPSRLITIKHQSGREGKEQDNEKLKKDSKHSTSKGPKGISELPHRTLTAGRNDKLEEK